VGHVLLVLPDGQEFFRSVCEVVVTIALARDEVANLGHVGESRRVGSVHGRGDDDPLDDHTVRHGHVSTFFHAPSYAIGANPMASLMSSIGRFSSAL
jgi:hypothetical protein